MASKSAIPMRGKVHALLTGPPGGFVLDLNSQNIFSLYIFPLSLSLSLSLSLFLPSPPHAGIGKTTLVKRVCSQLQQRDNIEVQGFYTEEVREGVAGGHGARIGFDVVTLDGQRAPLARVGRYAYKLHKVELILKENPLWN